MAGRNVTADEKREIIHLSYGNSAPVIAERFGLSISKVRKIIREGRGKQYPWGEREKDMKRNPSLRKFKKSMKKVISKRGHSAFAYHIMGPKRKLSAAKRKKAQNPAVYDSTGKLVGKFKRKAAKIVARVVGGSVGKPPKRNPETLLFKTKASAKKYAAAHGMKVKSLRKLSKKK